ncbi:glucose-fructose oxidoreductase, partial [Candidatus Poribacteria bacterium]
DSFHNGTEPELSGRRALNATEIIFSIYESSRRRSRIDLPLDIDDNPLVEMVESGALQPE